METTNSRNRSSSSNYTNTILGRSLHMWKQLPLHSSFRGENRNETKFEIPTFVFTYDILTKLIFTVLCSTSLALNCFRGVTFAKLPSIAGISFSLTVTLVGLFRSLYLRNRQNHADNYDHASLESLTLSYVRMYQ